MSAVEEIREAAGLMRSRAEAATPGPWSDNTPKRTRAGRHVGRRPDVIEPGAFAGDSLFLVTGSTAAPGTVSDAAYIASWHPVVALAVADFLDLAATHEERAGDDCGQGYGDTGYGYIDPSCSVCGTPDEYAQPWPCETVNRALMLARAYLGRSS